MSIRSLSTSTLTKQERYANMSGVFGAPPYDVDLLAIGGGGAGGCSGDGVGGGGGGAGEFWETSVTVFSGVQSLQVGAGGASVESTLSSNTGKLGGAGSNTFFGASFAIGGGGGGGAGSSTPTSQAEGEDGGSGGGGGWDSNPKLGGSSTAVNGLGNDGGEHEDVVGDRIAGGGGGAGAAGQDGSIGGNGGTGSTATINSTIYAGGGGGGTNGVGVTTSGGSGGGGAGGAKSSSGTAGTVNTGSGGGGSGGEGTGTLISSGGGGSGIIIFEIAKQSLVSFSAGVTHTVTSSGLKNRYTVTAAGPTDTVTIG